MSLLALVLLPLICTSSKQQVIYVHIGVIYNGNAEPAPSRISLRSKQFSKKIVVRNGRFVFPSEFLSAKSISFAAVVNGDYIFIPE
jgi:hypothetical protein